MSYFDSCKIGLSLLQGLDGPRDVSAAAASFAKAVKIANAEEDLAGEGIAHFWHARALLELGSIHEAKASAERAVDCLSYEGTWGLERYTRLAREVRQTLAEAEDLPAARWQLIARINNVLHVKPGP